MPNEVIRDIELVLGTMERPVRDRFFFQLDHVLETWEGKVLPRTRNEKSEPLGYFSLFLKEDEKPVIFAGALVKNEKGEKVPAVRFSPLNIFLEQVPTHLKFPYLERTPNWVYVSICRESVGYFLALMVYEVTHRLQNHHK